MLTVFKIVKSKYKCNDKNLFVECKSYKARKGLWELLAQSLHDKNVVTNED